MAPPQYLGRQKPKPGCSLPAGRRASGHAHYTPQQDSNEPSPHFNYPLSK